MRFCECGCERPLGPKQRKWATAACKPSPFDKNYAPYGTFTGRGGSPEDWRSAFNERFTLQEIEEFIGSKTSWEILGIAVGASSDQIKKAYRKKALETHPDLHPGIDRIHFQEVLAAYQQLMPQK